MSIAWRPAAGASYGARYFGAAEAAGVGAAEPHLPVEAWRLELHPGAALDIAGQESERDPRLGREPFEEPRDAGFRHDRLRPQPAAELFDVSVQDGGQRRLEPLRADRFEDQLPQDLRIGF